SAGVINPLGAINVLNNITANSSTVTFTAGNSGTGITMTSGTTLNTGGVAGSPNGGSITMSGGAITYTRLVTTGFNQTGTGGTGYAGGNGGAVTLTSPGLITNDNFLLG